MVSTIVKYKCEKCNREFWRRTLSNDKLCAKCNFEEFFGQLVQGCDLANPSQCEQYENGKCLFNGYCQYMKIKFQPKST